jgi:hypothetical protein
MISRRRVRSATTVVLAMLIIATAATGVQRGHAATSSNLSVASSGTVLTAARNNTLTLVVTNVGKYLKELDVALTIPPPLVLFGDNHWIKPWFVPGQSIHANLTVFAPSSTAGTTTQGSIVAVYKVTGETTPSTETHAISFMVHGWIDIQVYEITVDPSPAVLGHDITISGNILNRGVVAAMYTNVTADAGDTFVQGSVTPTYVGEVDPNAPAPFSVTAIINSNSSEGTHTATISVYYTDDLQLNHAMNVSLSFDVVAELPTTETTKTDIVSQLLSLPLSILPIPVPILLLGLVIIIVLVIVGIYLRRRHRHTNSD